MHVQSPSPPYKSFVIFVDVKFAIIIIAIIVTFVVSLALPLRERCVNFVFRSRNLKLKYVYLLLISSPHSSVVAVSAAL